MNRSGRDETSNDLKTSKKFDIIYMKDEGADKPLKTEKEVDTMEKTAKMTYVNALDVVLAGAEMTDEVKEKLEALKASLVKRNAKTGTRKPTKTQRENAEIKAQIVEFLTDKDPMKAGEIGAAFEFSTQKASALLKQLVDEGAVVKGLDEKKATVFSLAPIAE